MELTAAAAWLNSFFAGYDRLILTALHAVANPVFTFLFRLITLIGEKGIIFFLAALVFMCFPKTRRLGVCIFGSVCCGALITNVILKDLVARPRPFNFEPYVQWWANIGAPAEDEWSFPSGHVTAAAAGIVAIRLMRGKKWTIPAVVWVVIMMVARNYLMAHYPSDVLVGAIIGTASAFIAYYIAKFIFDFLYINRRKSWCSFLLNFSVPDIAGIPSRLGLTGEYEPEDNREEDEQPVTRSRRTRAAKAADPDVDEEEPAETEEKSRKKISVSLPKSIGKKSSGYQGKHCK